MDIYTIVIAIAILGLFIQACRGAADKKRLDWLERTRSEIDTEGPGFIIYNDESELAGLGSGASSGAFRNLRDAIDAAILNAEAHE